jgi:peptidyl-prolyl cis-trans isomerase C
MTFKPARLLLALIAVAAMPAFAQNLAVVNGKAIPKSRGDALAQQVLASGQQKDSPELRAMIKNELVMTEVLMQEAVKRGFDKNADVKSELDAARQEIIMQAMAQDYVGKNKPTDAEIKAEYDRAKTLAGDKQYKVRHILVGTEAEATALIAKIKAGTKFEEAAKGSKDSATANQGGDLDWITPSEYPKTFADAVVALNKGAVTDKPVQTANGFHVIKVDDTRAQKLPAMEEVKDRVAKVVAQKKLQAYRDSLIQKAVIK